MKSRFLKKIASFKELKIWFYTLKFLIIPVYNYFWEFLLNFHGKLLYLKWKKKNFDFYNFKGDPLIVRNDVEIKKLAKEINSFCTDSFVEAKKSKILSPVVDNKKDHPDNYIEGKKKFSTTINFDLSNDVREKIYEFALSDKILTTASNYLKSFPVLSILETNIMIPTETLEERGSMLWHKDDFAYKSLDIFIAITPVDENNGPTNFVKKKNILGIFSKYKNIKKDAKPGERGKIEREIFLQYHSEGEVDYIKGDLGTALFMDNCSTYHKGGLCKKDLRIMLRLSFQTPDGAHAGTIEDYSPTEFLTKIRNKYKNDLFRNYALTKKFNPLLKFINLQEILLKFYYMIHYKI